MTNKALILVVIASIAVAAVSYFLGYDHGAEKAVLKSISSFEDCAAAGYPVMESYPEQCNTPDGKHFVREIQETPTEPPPVQPGYPLEPVACPMDAKICPDGTGVGRTGPNCAFAPCPGDAE